MDAPRAAWGFLLERGVEDDERDIYVTAWIIDDSAPITLAVCNLEDGLLFLTSPLTEEQEVDRWVAVTLEGALWLDPSIRDVLDLPPGWEARRASVDTAWERRPLYSRTPIQLSWWPSMIAVIMLCPFCLIASAGFSFDLIAAAMVGFAEGILTVGLMYFAFRRRWQAAAGWFGEAEAQRVRQQTNAQSESILWSTLWLVLGLAVISFLGVVPVYIVVVRLNLLPDPNFVPVGIFAWLGGCFWGWLRLWNWLIKQRDQKLGIPSS